MGVGHKHVRRAADAYSDPTTFVIAAAWPILIAETRNDPPHVPLIWAKRRRQSPCHVGTQRAGHRQAVRLNFDFHSNYSDGV